MTSVKQFRVAAEPTATDLGRGRFVFTDDYSVFDWGQMPDPLPGKGASLCTMGAFNFEQLEAAGVPTHYRGVIPRRGDEAVPLAEAEQPPREMAIELTQAPALPFTGDGYEYESYYADAGEHYLVPLEIVFRNRVPIGSSLRTRTEPRDVGLDRDAWPEAAIDLPEPVVEFSTKYEEQDRYVDRAEAAEIAGAADIADLESVAEQVNRVVTDRAETAGFTHEDGKIEVLYHQGTVKVADVVGTFDENRFSYDGQQVSKEVVRQWYKREHPEWVKAVGAAKEAATERGVADWRPLCESRPRTLPETVQKAVAELYQAGTNVYTGDQWFDAPAFETVLETVQNI